MTRALEGFLGRYDYQIDPKGRVSLPAAFRSGGDEASTFVLVQYEEACLTLFPRDTWAEVTERLLAFRKEGRIAQAQVRRIAAGAVEVSTDRQGRILIPSRLQEAGGLSGSVVVIGNINRIELWDPERYRQAEEEAGEGFESFAHEIFGL